MEKNIQTKMENYTILSISGKETKLILSFLGKYKKDNLCPNHLKGFRKSKREKMMDFLLFKNNEKNEISSKLEKDLKTLLEENQITEYNLDKIEIPFEKPLTKKDLKPLSKFWPMTVVQNNKKKKQKKPKVERPKVIIKKNICQWQSIEQLPKYLKKLLQKNNLKNTLLNSEVFYCEKYDGTNVGIDEHKNMYGRTLMIDPSKKKYQKTDLSEVKKINVLNLRTKILPNFTDEETKFIIIGELMCNPHLFDYTNKKLDGQFPLFGAVIVPKDNDIGLKIMKDLLNNGFYCTNPYKEDLDGFIGQINLIMNEKLRDIFVSEGYCIPLLNGKKKMKDMILDNYDFMVNGKGEGIVMSLKDWEHDGFLLLKWKIGLEPQMTNIDIFKNIIKEEKWRDIGETEDEITTLKEIFIKMGEISKSQNTTTKIQLNKKDRNAYNEAIQSAKTKFDSSDTFYNSLEDFRKYVELIAEECKKDLKVKNEVEHFKIIEQELNEDYQKFLKN